MGFTVDGGEVFLGSVADVADHLGLFTNDNGPLGTFFNVNGGSDGHERFGIVDLIDGNSDGVG